MLDRKIPMSISDLPPPRCTDDGILARAAFNLTLIALLIADVMAFEMDVLMVDPKRETRRLYSQATCQVRNKITEQACVAKQKHAMVGTRDTNWQGFTK